MNPLEIVHFIEELIRSEAKVIAFFLGGVGFAVAAVYTIRKWIFPPGDMEKLKTALANKDAEIARKDQKISESDHKLEIRDAKVAALTEKLVSADEKHDAAKNAVLERNAELSKTCEDLKDETVDLAEKCKALGAQIDKALADKDLLYRKAVTVVTSHKKQVLELSEKIRQIEALEGRLWESQIRTTITPFRRLKADGCAIIAVANLKGGVGKTTISANVAATYARMGKRVLVVDLDHQTSLTTLCLTVEQIKDLRPGAGRFVNNLLKATSAHASVAWDNVTSINHHDAHILAASKELAEVEEHVKAKWMLNLTGFDSRYILRAALHDKVIQDCFDIILLDCPPRPSTCLINALTCCDYVMIPAKPDRPSTDTAPYFLGWLKKLREQNVCPHLMILGLVANEAYPRKKMISRENSVWSAVASKCEQEWGAPVYQFDRFVPKNAQFAEAAASRTFAADHPSLEPIFTALVDELEERRAQHANFHIATVS